MKITKRIIKVGNGQGVLINKSNLIMLKLKVGDILELDIKRAKIEWNGWKERRWKECKIWK